MTSAIDNFARAAASGKPDCPRCFGAGTYAYDHNHRKICELCCPHDQGYWLLPAGYTDAGKWACKVGCGFTVDCAPPKS